MRFDVHLTDDASAKGHVGSFPVFVSARAAGYRTGKTFQVFSGRDTGSGIILFDSRPCGTCGAERQVSGKGSMKESRPYLFGKPYCSEVCKGKARAAIEAGGVS